MCSGSSWVGGIWRLWSLESPRLVWGVMLSIVDIWMGWDGIEGEDGGSVIEYCPRLAMFFCIRGGDELAVKYV